MNSSVINNTFEDIESYLNRIYEKLRELEDLHEFTQEYIQNEFVKLKPALDASIVSIQEAGDLYGNTREVSHAAAFDQSFIVTDRDGSAVKPAAVIEGSTVTAGSIVLKEIQPVNSVVNSTETAYRRQDFPADEYRSFYAAELPYTEGVTEEINFLFSRTVTANAISVLPFGAELVSVSLIKPDDSLVEIDREKLSFSRQEIVGIKLKLKCSKFAAATFIVSDLKTAFSRTYEIYTDEVLDTIYDTYVNKQGAKISCIST